MTTSVIVTSPDGQQHGFQSMREAWEFIWIATITVFRYGHGFKDWIYEWFKVALQDPYAWKKKKIQNVADIYKRIEERRRELGHPLTFN